MNPHITHTHTHTHRRISLILIQEISLHYAKLSEMFKYNTEPL